MASLFEDLTKPSSVTPGAGGSMFETIPPESFVGGVARGGKEAFQQLPQLGYGMLAGAGAAIESAAGEGGIGTGIKKAGLAGYTRWGDKIAADAHDSDTWDYSWDQAKEGNFGALVSWLAHGIGYTGGQGIQMLVGAGVGTIAGKATLGTVAESLAAGLVKKEALRLAEGDAAKAATADVIKAATANVAGTIGQTSAVAAGSFGQEAGQIFGDLTQDADKAGATLTGAQLGKAFGASLVAGGLEFVGDKLGLDVVLGKSPLLKLAPNAKGIGGRLARGAIAAGAEAPAEGATEYFQSGLEQYGSGQDQNILPWNQNEENQRQARESAALGILGGVVMGGFGGMLHGPRKQPAPPPPVVASTPVDRLAAILEAPDLEGALREFKDAVAPGLAPPAPAHDGLQFVGADHLGLALGDVNSPEGPTFRTKDAADIWVGTNGLIGRYTVNQEGDKWRATPTAQELEQRGPIPVGEATELNPPTLTDELTNSIRSIPIGEVSEEDLANVTAPLLPVGEATEMLPVGQTSEIPTLTDVVPPGSALRRLNIPTLTDETTAPLGQRVPNIPVGETSVPPLGTATEAWAKANAHIESILKGDLLTRDGMPYGSKTAANLRAQREGLDPTTHVIEIPNAGWVVRPILQVAPGNAPGFTAQNTPGVLPQQPGAITAPGAPIIGGAAAPGGQPTISGPQQEPVGGPAAPPGTITPPNGGPALIRPGGPLPGEIERIEGKNLTYAHIQRGANGFIVTTHVGPVTQVLSFARDIPTIERARAKAHELLGNVQGGEKPTGEPQAPQAPTGEPQPPTGGPTAPGGPTTPGGPTAPAGEPPKPPEGGKPGGEITGGPTAPEGGTGTAPQPPTTGEPQPPTGGGGITGGPEPTPPKPPEVEKPPEKPPEKPEPVRSEHEQDLLDMGTAIAAGDSATVAKIVYRGIREHTDEDVPIVLPEDRLARFPVKLEDLKKVEERLIALKFRVSDKLQETKESNTIVVSAIHMPKKGEITGGGKALPENKFARPQAGAPDDDWDKALDKMLRPLHPAKLLDPQANANQTFGNMMFKEAVYSLVDYPLAFIASGIRKRFAGYKDTKSDRDVLKTAMQNDVQFEFMQARAAQYLERLTKLAATLTPHDGIHDALAALVPVYFAQDGGLTAAGTDLHNTTSEQFTRAKVMEWFKKFSADENSTDQTDRVKKKDPDMPPPLSDIRRVGMKDHRGGKDITDAEAFVDAFGFRGVKFGNWVNQAERQAQMNLAYDSLMDLADEIGMDPKMIGLGGRLGLGIGAYGNEKTSAAAFYKPDDELFNLTKDNGRGTVAHEWFHAFEDITTKYQKGPGGRDAAAALFASLPKLYKSYIHVDRADKAMRASLVNAADSQNRNEPPKTAFVLTAFKALGQYGTGLVRGLREPMRFYWDAAEMDEGGGKPYWSTPVEMLARGFETLVYDQTEGGTPFLVGPSRADGYMTKKNGYEGTPYPSGKERVAVADLYREMLKWIDLDTLQVKSYKRDVKVIELPDGRFTAIDQYGLGTLPENYMMAPTLFTSEALAQKQAELQSGKDHMPTVVQILFGRVNLQAVEFASNIDKIMEEMGIKPWPEIKDGSMVESMLQHLRYGWWPTDNKVLREFAATAHEVADRELNPLQMKQAQEDFEAALARYAHQITVDMRRDGADSRAIYDKMVALYKAQPRLAERTMESALMQAYSTPLPIAWISGLLARVGLNTKVFDATGGNGMLTIAAEPSKVTLIEKLASRLRNLNLLKFGRVLGGDFFAEMPKIRDQEADVVLFNPPFGSLPNGEVRNITGWNGNVYDLRKLDHAIAAEGMRAMADKGRGVVILGANKATGEATITDKKFLSWLYSNYNVADHFEIDGDMYTRQGAGWPIRVLVIAGRNHTQQVYHGDLVIDRVDSWESLWSRYERALSNSEQVLVGAGKQTGPVRGPATGPGAVPGGGAIQGPVTGGAGGGTGQGPGTGEPGAGGTGAGPTGAGGGGLGGTTGGVFPPGPTGGPSEPGAGPSGQPGGVQGGAGATGRTGSTGSAPVDPNDIENLINNIFGDDDEDAPTPPPRPDEPKPRKKPAEPTGGATGDKPQGTLPKPNPDPNKPPEPPKPPKPPKPGKSILDDIPGLDGLLDALDTIVGGGTVDPKILEDLTADKPTGSAEDEAIDKVADETGMTEAMARAGMAPTSMNLPDILSAQRRDAEAMLRDIRRANDAMLEARENPTAKPEAVDRPMFSRAPNEDATYVEYRKAFVAIWEHLKKTISDFMQRANTFGMGVLQRYGKGVKQYVMRFITEMQDAEKKKPIEAEEVANETQAPYQRRSQLKNSQGVLIPKHQASRLYDVMDRIERAVGDFDEYVRTKLGYDTQEELKDALFDYQVDAVAIAIHKMENGGAFIVGDDTGVGKGRTGAALISWAVEHGKTPVFVTVGQPLFGDMYRDLQGIGRADLADKILITNADDEVRDDDDNVVIKPQDPEEKEAAFKYIMDNGALPPHLKIVFTTYHQVNAAGNARQRLLSELVKSGKAVLIMDEAHNAAGDSNRGKFLTQILTGEGLFGKLPGSTANAPAPAGWSQPPVTLLSATFAKHAKNMPFYSRTDLGHVGTRDGIIGLFTGRGNAMTEVVSEMLVEAGSMIRRERSYSGVGFSTFVDEKNAPRDERLVDEVTTVLRQILRANQAFIGWAEGAGRPVINSIANSIGNVTFIPAKNGGMNASVNLGNFASVAHNIIGQLLFATKIDSLVQRTIDGLNGGLHRDGMSQKIFIAFNNTMESMMNDFMESANLKDGDEVPEFGWQHVVARSGLTARRANFDTVSFDPGDKAKKRPIAGQVKVTIPLNVMPGPIAREFERIAEMLETFRSELPASPVDMITQKLEQYSVVTSGQSVRVTKDANEIALAQQAIAAGVKGITVRPLRVGEISGRTKTVNYMAAVPTINSRKRSDTRQMVGGFQNGTVDVLLANAAGSTGLSAHADVKVKDQRPRHMLIAQANPDIAIFKQTTGRTHRTGQVEWPDFTVFATGIPAERRALAMLKKKVGVLMSGTTAGKGTMNIEATDFVNDYGDAIVNEYLKGNREVANFVGVRNPMSNSEDAQGTGLAHKVTNKVALLPSDQQRDFFEYVEEKYLAEIAARDATGTNELTRTMEDLQAEMDPDEYRLIENGIDENNPFLRPVVMAKYKVNVSGEIPTPTTVREAVTQSLNGRTPDQAVDDIEKSLGLGYDAAVATWQSRLVELRAEQQKSGLSARETDDLAARVRAVEGTIKDFSTVKARTLDLLREKYTIGRPITQLDLNAVQSQAVVIGYRVSKNASGGGNPFAPSNISIVLQRNVPGGAVPLPLSKLEPSGAASLAEVNYWRKDFNEVVDDWFSLRNTGGGTENRWIMTGNLPRGRILVPGGDVIKFTIAGEQNPANGIKFPKAWAPGNAGKATNVQVRYIESAREFVLDFLSHLWGGRYGFEDEMRDVNAMRVHPEISMDDAEYQSVRDVSSILLRGNGWDMRHSGSGFYFATDQKSQALKDLLGDMPKQRNGPYQTPNAVRSPRKIIDALNILSANNPPSAAVEAGNIVQKLVQAHYYDANPGARPAPEAPKASIGRRRRGGQPVERVRSFVDAVRSKWANAPDVVVVQSFDDPALPESAREEFARLSEANAENYGVPQGWYAPPTADTPARIYLIADQMHSDAITLKVLMHEALGHYGLRGVFGAEFGAMLDRFAVANEARVRKAAQELGYDYGNVTDRRAAAEETLAYMAENTPKYGWVRKALAAITGWLRRHVPGFSKMGLSESEIIRDFIVPARDWVQRGGTPTERAQPFGAPMFRRHSILNALRSAGGGEKIVGNTGRPYEADTLEAMRHTGMMVDRPTLEQRVKQMWSGAGEKIAQGLFDQFAPVKSVSTEAYNLLRLSKGASGAFETLLKGGLLKLTDRVYDFDERARGGAIDRWMKPLQGEHHDFLRWVAAHRAEALMPEDREHLFREQDIQALKKLANGTTAFDYTLKNDTGGLRAGTVTRDRTLIYADSLKTFNEFNKNVLDMAEQSGLIDAESRAIWEKEFYVPFYRVADDSDGGVRGMNIKNGVVRQQAFKHLKGGTSKLNTDLMDNVLMNWAHLIDASAKNRAGVATMDALVAAGRAFESTETAARQAARSMGVRDQVVWVMDEGKKRFFVVDDKAMLTAVTALEFAGMRGPAMKVLGGFKHALTIGVTASPFFKVRNLIRDSIQAISTAPIGYNPLANIKEGFALTKEGSDSYFRLLAGGGTIHFGTMLEGSEAKRIQALVESGVDPAHILNSDSKYKAFYRQKIEPLITAYNELGNRGEAVNRASLYAQLTRQGMNHAEASIAARDLMDFSLQGAWTAVRFLAQVVPFWNARLQGFYKLGRAAKEDPKRFYGVIGATALASVALMLAYSDDDDWKRREDWDRNNFWWFKIGGEAFRIPKPFEVGAIATLAERGFELFFDKEMTGQRFRQNVLALMSDQLSMNPIPQIVKPMIDVYANIEGYTGRPIETEGMKTQAPEYRMRADTSMVARAASTSLNTIAGMFGGKSLSPVQIDYLLQGYFSWLGVFAVQAADILARPMTGQPERPERDWLRTASGGMATDLTDAQSRYVSQMYQQGQMIEEAYHTWRQMAKSGNAVDAAAYLAEHREEISKYRIVERAKAIETKLNHEQQRVEASRVMSSEEKRARIRELMATRERVARPVTETIQ